MYSPASLKAEALGRRWLNKIIAQTPACWITVCREEGFVRQPPYTTVQWLIRPRSTSWGSWKADKIFLLADLPWLNVDKLYFYSLNFLTLVYNIRNITRVCWVHVFDHLWYFSRLNMYKQTFYVLHERLSYRVAGVTVYSHDPRTPVRAQTQTQTGEHVSEWDGTKIKHPAVDVSRQCQKETAEGRSARMRGRWTEWEKEREPCLEKRDDHTSSSGRPGPAGLKHQALVLVNHSQKAQSSQMQQRDGSACPRAWPQSTFASESRTTKWVYESEFKGGSNPCPFTPSTTKCLPTMCVAMRDIRETEREQRGEHGTGTDYLLSSHITALPTQQDHIPGVLFLDL